MVPASFPNSGGVGSALIQSNDTIERVDVVSKNSQANGVTSIIQGGTFRDVRFFGRAGGRFGYALGNTAGDACPNAQYALVADDVTVRDSSIAITADCPKVEAKVTDLITRGVGNSIYLQGGAKMTVENALSESGDGSPIQVLNSTDDGDTELRASHVTAIATGDETAPAIHARVPNLTLTDDVRIRIDSSAFVGFASTWFAEAADDPQKGDSYLEISYSNYAVPGTKTGNSYVTAGPGNVDVAPRFVDAAAGDYRPAPGSSLIDAGQPTIDPPDADLAGNPRPVDGDGDGDGSAIPDAGAFEYQPPAPTCETDPALCPDPPVPDTTKPKITKVKFSFKRGKRGSIRLNLSEPASVRAVLAPLPKRGKRKKVVIVRKSAKAGSFALKLGKRKLSPGRYRLTIVATDAAGNVSNPLVRKVRAKKR